MNAAASTCGPALTGMRTSHFAPSFSSSSAACGGVPAPAGAASAAPSGFGCSGFRGRRLRRRLRDVEQRDAPAVERDFELLVRHAVADVNAVDGAHEVDVDEVLRVEREEVLDAQAAARAERQPRDVLGLHQEVRHVVRLLLGRHAPRRRRRDARCVPPRSHSARRARARRRASPRRCRNRSSRRRRARAPWRRRRARADRGSRSRTRCGSADATPAGRDSGLRAASSSSSPSRYDDERLPLALVGTRLARRRHHAGSQLANDFFPLRRVRARCRRRRAGRGRSPRTAPSRSRLPRCGTCMQVVSRNACAGETGASLVCAIAPAHNAAAAASSTDLRLSDASALIPSPMPGPETNWAVTNSRGRCSRPMKPRQDGADAQSAAAAASGNTPLATSSS